jgi:hypothetical protein
MRPAAGARPSALVAIGWALTTGATTALGGHFVWGEPLSVGSFALSLGVFLVIGAPMYAWLARRLDHRRTEP